MEVKLNHIKTTPSTGNKRTRTPRVIRAQKVVSLKPRYQVSRTRWVMFGLFIGFMLLLLRSFYLQSIQKHFLHQKGNERYSRVVEISAHRGTISDRQGEPLAMSTPVMSIWMSPKDVQITIPQFKNLVSLLDLKEDVLRKQMSREDKDFVYIKRHVPPELANQVMRLGISGIFQQREYRRYYPAGEVTAQLVGMTDLDDKGQEGMELAYQDWLAGKNGSQRVIKDRLGHIIEDLESIKQPQQGRDLVLSIDRNIQYLAYRELKQAVVNHNAKGGAILVLDAQNGEILALANAPSFNPNNRGKLSVNALRNRSVIDLFEPGSTLKPFTAAAALETGQYHPETIIDTQGGSLSIGPATIHDAHQNGVLSLAQIIQRSSNVGTAKVALSLSSEYLWTVLRKSGFGSAPNSTFPGEVSGRLRQYKNWRPIEQATISYGHGISVSLLQLARAYTVFASNGELKPVSLLKRPTNVIAGDPVFSQKTILSVRKMLEMAVSPGGTAPRAQVLGYRVAGKTGTAHKIEGAGYAADKYVSSFVGFAPASNPRVIIAVMLDEPSNGEYYGGTVAAPVFSKVMAGTLRLLSIPPDRPNQNKLIPIEDTPQIKEIV